jgi:transposase
MRLTHCFRKGGLPRVTVVARKLQGFGHKVRIVAAKFVKPYVKSNKSDIIDAEAIAEALRAPRCGSLKSGPRSD